MRWENLFDDLESQLEQEHDAGHIDQLAEEERLRLSRLTIRDRIASLSAHERPGYRNALHIQLRSGEMLVVHVSSFGKDWIAADIVGGFATSQCIVPLQSIDSLALTAEHIQVSTETAPSMVQQRLVDRIGLPFVLRDLCRRRSSVDVITAVGAKHGTIDRVGRDHLDLAVHEVGSLRRATNVSEYRLIPFESMSFVRI